jgi:hypothetical protein
MLALVASIHLLNTALAGEDVAGRDKPDHDGEVRPKHFRAKWIPVRVKKMR